MISNIIVSEDIILAVCINNVFYTIDELETLSEDFKIDGLVKLDLTQSLIHRVLYKDIDLIQYCKENNIPLTEFKDIEETSQKEIIEYYTGQYLFYLNKSIEFNRYFIKPIQYKEDEINITNILKESEPMNTDNVKILDIEIESNTGNLLLAEVKINGKDYVLSTGEIIQHLEKNDIYLREIFSLVQNNILLNNMHIADFVKTKPENEVQRLDLLQYNLSEQDYFVNYRAYRSMDNSTLYTPTYEQPAPQQAQQVQSTQPQVQEEQSQQEQFTQQEPVQEEQVTKVENDFSLAHIDQTEVKSNEQPTPQQQEEPVAQTQEEIAEVVEEKIEVVEVNMTVKEVYDLIKSTTENISTEQYIKDTMLSTNLYEYITHCLHLNPNQKYKLPKFLTTEKRMYTYTLNLENCSQHLLYVVLPEVYSLLVKELVDLDIINTKTNPTPEQFVTKNLINSFEESKTQEVENILNQFKSKYNFTSIEVENEFKKRIEEIL